MNYLNLQAQLAEGLRRYIKAVDDKYEIGEQESFVKLLQTPQVKKI